MRYKKFFTYLLSVFLFLICCYFTLIFKAKYDLRCYFESEIIPHEKKKAREMYLNFEDTYKKKYKSIDYFVRQFLKPYNNPNIIGVWLFGSTVVVTFVINDKDVYTWQWNTSSMTSQIQN